jgi:hypothetical protein
MRLVASADNEQDAALFLTAGGRHPYDLERVVTTPATDIAAREV